MKQRRAYQMGRVPAGWSYWLGLLLVVVAVSPGYSQAVSVRCSLEQFLGRTPVEEVHGYGAMDADGDLVAVGRRDELQIWDFSDPSLPVLASVIEPDRGFYVGASVAFSYPMLAFSNGTSDRELHLYDVKDLAEPRLLGTIDTAWTSVLPALGNGRVYIFSNSNLRIYSDQFFDNGVPMLLGSFFTGGSPRAVRLVGDLLYVTYLDYGLRIYDVSDPESVTEIGQVPFANREVLGLDVRGTLAVVSTDRRTKVIDVTDPSKPVVLSTIQTDQLVPEVEIVDDSVYISTEDGVEVYDLSDPSRPSFVRLITGPEILGGAKIGVLDSGIVIRGARQLIAIDPDAGAMSHRIGEDTLDGEDFPRIITGLMFHNGYGIAIDDSFESNSLIVIDFSDPDEPIVVGSHFLASLTSTSLAITNSTAYVGFDETWIAAVDLSDPTNPVRLHTWDTQGRNIGDIFIDDETQTLFLHSRFGNSRMRFDISDPLNPVRIAFSLDGNIFDQYGYLVEEGYEVFASDIYDDSDFNSPLDSVVVMDVRDPEHPSLVSRIVIPGGDTSGFNGGLEIADGILYVTTGGVGTDGSGTDGVLSAYDLRQGAALIGAVEFSRGAGYSDPRGGDLRRIIASDGVLYAPTFGESDSVTGIAMFDISDRGVINYLGSAATPGSRFSEAVATIDGDRLYLVAHGHQNLSVRGHVEVYDMAGLCQDCAVDLTGDGVLDKFDVFAFLDAFNASDLGADFTGDGSLDVFDVFAFLDVFNAGCP